MRQEMNGRSPLLVARLRDLASTAVFTRFEEIGAMQYVTDARGDPDDNPCTQRRFGPAPDRRAGDLRSRRRDTRHIPRLAPTRHRASCSTPSRHVICVTSEDREHFVVSGAHDVVVVPNGVDEELFFLPDRPGEDPRVLFFGSLLWRRTSPASPATSAEAWPRVVNRLPSAELRVAGPGPVKVIARPPRRPGA